jgi:hypothetical protein
MRLGSACIFRVHDRGRRKSRDESLAAPQSRHEGCPFFVVKPGRENSMVHMKTLLIAAPVALGLLASPAAHAEWRAHGGGGWGYHGGYGHRGGGALAGAILGLGAAAVIGGIIASQPPRVVYAPQPGYYAAPAYPRTYYSAPAYYPPPDYYSEQDYEAAE